MGVKKQQDLVDKFTVPDYGDHKPIVLNDKSREWFELKQDSDNAHVRGPPKPDQTWSHSDTQIFVSVASLRDDRCGRTLHSLFTQAEHPERVHIGVVQQNDEETLDCIDDYCARMQRGRHYNANANAADPYRHCPFIANIRTIRMQWTEAKGPNYARGLASSMINGEEFCLQIDSHVMGDSRWDSQLLWEWSRCDNEMAVLSTYLGSPEHLGKNVHQSGEVPHLCTAYFTGNVPFNDRASAARYLKKPIIAPLWAAGFSFSKCHSELSQTKYDVNLIQIWTGEEFGRGMRLWTHGYDFYTMTKPIIAHDYSAGKNQKQWKHDRKELDHSNQRLHSLLKISGSNQTQSMMDVLSEYNLGIKRTAQQYFEFTGVDTSKHEIKFDYCKDYSWVPFDYDEQEIEQLRLMMKVKNDDSDQTRVLNQSNHFMFVLLILLGGLCLLIVKRQRHTKKIHSWMRKKGDSSLQTSDDYITHQSRRKEV